MNLGFKDAAKKILKASDKPLSAEEITARAIKENLLSTSGLTPSATMAAQIYLDIKNNAKSEFIKVKAGLFALKSIEHVPTGIEYVARHNEDIRSSLRERLFGVDPKDFEFLIGALLEEIGFENIEVVGGSGDGGIDIMADLTVGGVTNVKTEIQAKRYKRGNNIGSKVVRELRGSAELTKRGLIITTSDFSKDAIEEAGLPNKMPVSLINGERLVELLVEHSVGVQKTQIEIFSIDEMFLENITGESISHGSKDSRSLGLWPLPGGTTEYLNTLTAILKYIASNDSTVDDSAKWIMKTYPTVESFKTARSYMGVPRALKLIENAGGTLRLSENGKKFLKSPTEESLKQVLEHSIVGIQEIIEALEKQEMTEKEIWQYLNDALDLQWKTFAQTRFRLLWLQNADVVERRDDSKRYRLR